MQSFTSVVRLVPTTIVILTGIVNTFAWYVIRRLRGGDRRG
jgi:hypothetical protein